MLYKLFGTGNICSLLCFWPLVGPYYYDDAAAYNACLQLSSLLPLLRRVFLFQNTPKHFADFFSSFEIGIEAITDHSSVLYRSKYISQLSEKIKLETIIPWPLLFQGDVNY